MFLLFDFLKFTNISQKQDFQVILGSLKTYGIFNCISFLNGQVYPLSPQPSFLDTAALAIFPCISPLLDHTFTNTFFPSTPYTVFFYLYMGILDSKAFCVQMCPVIINKLCSSQEGKAGRRTKVVQLFIYIGSSPQSTGILRPDLKNSGSAIRNKGLRVHSASL